MISDGWREFRADWADLFSKGPPRPQTVRVGTLDERREMIRSDQLEMSER
jgi:hypothetical protein